jgi:starvation-inducible DNA-binding protein
MVKPRELSTAGTLIIESLCSSFKRGLGVFSPPIGSRVSTRAGTILASIADMPTSEMKRSGRSAPEIEIGINASDREAIADGLGMLLADTYALYLKTQSFHWNVTGPMFRALHEMFEEQYTELASAVDVIAERIRALGRNAPASFSQFSKLTSIDEEAGTPAAEEMVRQLVTGHEAVVRTARNAFATAESAEDQVTQDMLTERMQVHEKQAWMLRSLLQ